MIILTIGIIEFSGVLSSCATDEKNIDRSFFACFFTFLILVMSVAMKITCAPPLKVWVLVYMYLLRLFTLNTSSIIVMPLLSLVNFKILARYDFRFSFLGISGSLVVFFRVELLNETDDFLRLFCIFDSSCSVA